MASTELFCQDWPWTMILPISVSYVVGMTGLSHGIHLSNGCFKACSYITRLVSLTLTLTFLL
jgi:hypothetical protein